MPHHLNVSGVISDARSHLVLPTKIEEARLDDMDHVTSAAQFVEITTVIGLRCAAGRLAVEAQDAADRSLREGILAVGPPKEAKAPRNIERAKRLCRRRGGRSTLGQALGAGMFIENNVD